MPDEIGLRPYQKAGRSKPERVFAALMQKSRLRAALAATQADIDASLPSLNGSDLKELQRLLAGAVAAADADAADLAAQVAAEAELAQTQRAMRVTVSRQASEILGVEVERRIRRGVFPSVEGLIGEAVARAYGGR